METPIVFIIFNRPEETARVFAEIRRVQPSQLLIIADGPRNETDRPLCNAARSIATTIDWPCSVLTNFSEKNLGCGKRISSGLAWVFSQVEEAIILEDDCVPNQSFFPFCVEMLTRYRNEQRVMHIAGTSVQEGNRHFHPHESYYFSLLANVWGWATWRRAWEKYDFTMARWPELKTSGELASWMNHPAAYERFTKVWDQYYRHEIDSWDGQWTFACLAEHGLCINPSVNLVSNIGFNDRGTHFKGRTYLGNRPTKIMEFPLIHPQTLTADRAADAFKYRYSWGIDRKYIYRLLRPLKTHFPIIYRTVKRLFKKS